MRLAGRYEKKSRIHSELEYGAFFVFSKNLPVEDKYIAFLSIFSYNYK